MKSLSLFRRSSSLFNFQVSFLNKVGNKFIQKGQISIERNIKRLISENLRLQVRISKARYLSLGSFRSVDVSFPFVAFLFLMKYFPFDAIYFKCVFVYRRSTRRVRSVNIVLFELARSFKQINIKLKTKYSNNKPQCMQLRYVLHQFCMNV